HAQPQVPASDYRAGLLGASASEESAQSAASAVPSVAEAFRRAALRVRQPRGEGEDASTGR
ncbi:unnamed protein product, partial [Effrenium voratum]